MVHYKTDSYLFPTVHDVLGEGESATAGTADDGVVPGRCVRHLHGTELEERLTQHHPTQQQLSGVGPITWVKNRLGTKTNYMG